MFCEGPVATMWHTASFQDAQGSQSLGFQGLGFRASGVGV